MKHKLALILLFLTSCSFAPIPINVNLLEDGFPEAKGSFAIATPSSQLNLLPNISAQTTGTLGPFSSPITGVALDIKPIANFLNIDLNIPNQNGFLIDFKNQNIPAQLNSASLSYQLELSKTGPVVAKFSLQTYLAPNGTDDLVQDKYKLGQEQTVNFTGASLANTISLNAEQLRGINEKELRLVIVITEGTLNFATTGAASISYELSKLELNIAQVTTSIRQAVPTQNGISFNFANAELPATGRIINLGVDYGIKLNITGNLQGSVNSQVYLAPANVTDILQEKYALGTPQPIDLSQTSQRITERANFNQEQLKVLDTKTAKFIILITGDSSLALGQTIEIDYEFDKLELFGGYSLN